MSSNEKNIPKRRFKEFLKGEAWEERKIGDIADIVRGASPRPIQDPKWFDNENSEIGWLRISDVTEQNGRIHFLEQRISKEGQDKTRVLLEPHLLLSIAATVGKPVINYVKTGVHDGFLIFLNPKFDREYMFQWLEMFRPQWQQFGQPGSQVNLNSEIVRNAEICIPTFREQQEIGNFFTNLDNLITLHQRKLDKLKVLKKAYLAQMFPSVGESKPRLRFSGFNDDWEQRKVGEWGTFYYGHSCPKWSVTEDATTPCIRYGELYTKFGAKIDKVFSYTNIPTDKLRFSKGTEVLIPRVGEDPMDYNHCTWLSIPDIAIGEMISVYNTEQNPFFTATMFNATLQKEFASRVEGGSVTNLYFEKLKNIDVLFPSLVEQEKIATYFERFDNLITLYQRKLEKLQNIKKAYLSEMFV